jgi:hypothetical protein
MCQIIQYRLDIFFFIISWNYSGDHMHPSRTEYDKLPVCVKMCFYNGVSSAIFCSGICTACIDIKDGCGKIEKVSLKGI